MVKTGVVSFNIVTLVMLCGITIAELYAIKINTMATRTIKVSLNTKQLILNCLTLFLVSVCSFLKANPISYHPIGDSSIAAAIRLQLIKKNNVLYYPLSVQRFYKQWGYKLAWVAPDTIKTHAYDAMLLLDCVLQYGLSHADYYPNELLYDKLNRMAVHPNQVSNTEKAVFDILLTDAILRFINNLHYGKLNQQHPASTIDADIKSYFRAENVLTTALNQTNFIKVIEQVQPQITQYVALQRQMHLLAGVYTGDCYDTPQSTLQQIAINMERLRWVNISGKTYIHINIPSRTLTLHQTGTEYTFKIITGKSPTPTFTSSLSYFSTVPVQPKLNVNEGLPQSLKNLASLPNNYLQIYDREGRPVEPTKANLQQAKQNPSKYYIKMLSPNQSVNSAIVFNVPNSYKIKLIGAPDKQLFNKPQRAISNGSIRVEEAIKLASQLLTSDNQPNIVRGLNKAIYNNKIKTFRLKTTVPVIVTYLTCQMKEGVLETYNDIYLQDKKLETALYSKTPVFAKK